MTHIWCSLNHPLELGYKIVKTDDERAPWRVKCDHCGYEHDGVRRLH